MTKRNSDDLADRYCEALIEFQEHCEAEGLNFRKELIGLLERWKEQRTEPRRGRDAREQANQN